MFTFQFMFICVCMCVWPDTPIQGEQPPMNTTVIASMLFGAAAFTATLTPVVSDISNGTPRTVRALIWRIACLIALGLSSAMPGAAVIGLIGHMPAALSWIAYGSACIGMSVAVSAIIGGVIEGAWLAVRAMRVRRLGRIGAEVAASSRGVDAELAASIATKLRAMPRDSFNMRSAAVIEALADVTDTRADTMRDADPDAAGALTAFAMNLDIASEIVRRCESEPTLDPTRLACMANDAIAFARAE